MPSRSLADFSKRKLIRKTHPIFSSGQISAPSKHHITNNFLKFLRNIAHPNHPRPTNPLISFLNINQMRQSQKQTSLHYIPSIQNMISQQNIQGEQQIDSVSSIERGFSDEIISQHNYELRVLFVCMIEKIMKRLQYHTSESQRKKIIRGTWNILMKYCKDLNYFIFNNIGTKIQWGLLELINFNFTFSFKEKNHAELLLNSRKQRSSIISLKYL